MKTGTNYVGAGVSDGGGAAPGPTDEVVDSTISSGTLYVNFQTTWSMPTTSVQLYVNDAAVTGVLSVSANGVTHFSVSSLGITPGKTVTLRVVTSSNTLGAVSWVLGP